MVEPPASWHPRFEKPTSDLIIGFERGGIVASLYLASFAGGAEGGDATSSGNHPEGSNQREAIARDVASFRIAEAEIPVTRLTFGEGGGARTIWLSYWIGGKYYSSRIEAALRQLWLSAGGGDTRSGIVVVSIEEASLGGRSADAEAASLVEELPELLRGPVRLLAGPS